MKKLIFTLLLIIGFAATGFSQSDKMKEKAIAKVEQINNQIISVDKSLALTVEQRKQILEVQMTKMQEIKKLRKGDADKDAIKVVSKKYNQKIFKDILTKEQMKARKQAKNRKQ